MPVNYAAENAPETIVPQVIISYREKSTEGLSPWLMFIWALSAPFLGVYMIAQTISIPLILQPQLFGAMSALSWIQCLYYSYHKSKIYCSLVYSTFLVLAGGFQGGFVLLVRHKYEDGDVWSLRTFALMSSILLSAGYSHVIHDAYSPQYWEIWKRKGSWVRMSILFMTMDTLGGVFSALSLVFKETFDTFAAIPYLFAVVSHRDLFFCSYIL
ncbi:hypothetical protein B0J17DRAFT_681286 [Rhizoctonia solani]|nr:hypothetical protein B0J17DRAFT_681286 [Rhizoctonia solani]